MRFLSKVLREFCTYYIPGGVIFVDIFHTDRSVDVFHLYVHSREIQIPFALTQYLVKWALDESLAIEIDSRISIARFVALQIVVFGVDQMLSVQWNGQWYYTGLRETLRLFNVVVGRVHGRCFVRPENVDFVVGILF